MVDSVCWERRNDRHWMDERWEVRPSRKLDSSISRKPCDKTRTEGAHIIRRPRLVIRITKRTRVSVAAKEAEALKDD